MGRDRDKSGRIERLLADIQAEKDKLTALLNSIQDEVWFADTDRHFTLANAAALREFGVRSGEVVEVERLAANLEVLRPDGTPRPVEEAPPLRALRGEVVTDQEEIARTPASGELRYRQVNAAPVKDKAGKIIGSVSVVRDITERKRAEDLLRRNEDFLTFSLATARIGAWDLDLVQHTARRSPQHDRIFGYHELLPEWTYETFLDHVVPEDRDAVDRKFRHAVDTRSDWSFECRIIRRDGRIRWIWVAGRHRLDDTGQPRRMAGIVQDITDRKETEEALRESEERFRTMADSSPIILWVTDEDGGLRFVNRTYRQFFGVSYAQVQGGNWQPLVHPHDHQSYVHSFINCLRERRSFVGEARVRRADGDWRWLASHAEPHFSPGGDFLGYVGVSSDITERKRAEEALREANLQLADTDRRKNEFLAILSHELRNPLAPIRYSLHMLRQAAPGGDAARQALDVLDRQTVQLTRLVDDLLDVTRVSREKIQLQRGRIELNDLVRRTVDDHRSLFEAKDITVDVSLANAPLSINGDPARLAQVIGNLLQNAAKFTPAGGRVHVEARIDASGSRGTVRVADTGAGIEPEMLRRLFQPFMQAETTLDRTRGGLGLGLALVKGLVEMHGGEVVAHSDGLGKGAEFVIALPLDEAGIEQSSAVQTTGGRGRRVLIIEDNVDAADSLRAVLEFQDHLVEVAYDGAEGLMKARQFGPEVVFCDIGLPGMDGFAVARAFKADESLGRAVLVALSGYALPDDLQRAAEAGFDRHLAKPASPETLERLLADLPPPALSDRS